MLDNGQTSNFGYNTVVTRWKSGKMIGPSSVGLFLHDSIFHPSDERAAFEMNPCYFGFLFVFGSHEISSLEFSCGRTFAYPLEVFIGSQKLIKKCYVVSQSSRPLPIDCIRSSFFPSVSIIASSNGRFPLLGLDLRWADDRDVSDGAGVCIELSAEEHSATKSSSILEQLSFFRLCWLPIKLFRLQLRVAFHFSSIRSN